MRKSLRIVVTLICSVIPSLTFAGVEEDEWGQLPHGMKDRYLQASAHFDEPWVLQFADSLAEYSESSGEKLLLLYADQLRCHHAFNERDSLQFVAYSEEARDLARKLGRNSDYFAEMTNAVFFYTNIGEYHIAQHLAQSMVSDGNAMNDASGIYYGYYALGTLFSTRGAYSRSTESYLKALDYLEQSGARPEEKAQLYCVIALNYLEVKDFARAREYAALSLDTYPSIDDALACMAISSFSLNDYDAFRLYKSKYSDKDDNTSISEDYYNTIMEVLDLALYHKYKEALELTDRFDGSAEQYDLQVSVYRLMHEWDKALEAARMARQVQYSSYEEMSYEELEQLSDELNSMSMLREQDARIVRQRTLIYIYSLLILVIVTCILIYFIRSRAVMKEQKRHLHQALQYQRLVDNLPFSFSKARLIFGDDGKVADYITVDANYTVRKAMSKAGVAMGSRTVVEAYPHSAPGLIALINNAREHGLPYLRCSFDLTEFDQSYEIVILLDDSSIIQIFSINTSEISKAHKELEEKNIELEAAVAKALKADTFKTQFIKNMSHEIRTPMNAIMGFSQLLSMPDGFNTEEEKAQYASYIQSNSNMLLMLIDDILELGDAEKGALSIELTDFPANDICRQAMNSVEFRCPPSVNMHFETDAPDSFVINSDPRRVQQVLINYLTNACKHTSRGEIRLDLSLSANPDFVSFSVTDTGTGVPAELAEDIFERFMKVDEFKQGAGLGLNVCSTIASRLNGKVFLDTSYKDGARFFFVLPIVK